LTKDLINRPNDKPFVAREFIPSEKKSFITLNRIHILSLLLTLPLIYLHSIVKSNHILSMTVNVAFGLSLFTAVITRIIAFVSFEPLNGQFADKITLNKKGIEVNKKFYDFNEIQDISIDLNHYYKQRGSGLTAHPAYSNGVDNKLSFRQSGLYNYSCFQISSKEHLLDFIEYLKSLDSSVKINVAYNDRSIRVQDFDPKIYGLT
jgi:hypothetical protein